MINAKIRNGMLTASLEAEDTSDDTYILPGKQLTHRIAYDESDWGAGKKTRIGFISWIHYEDKTVLTCKPVLMPAKSWTINNVDDTPFSSPFRIECDRVMDELSDYLKIQGI